MASWLLAGLAVVCVLAALAAALWPGLVLRLGSRWTLYHAGRVPDAGPVLVVANHASRLDWLALVAASPRRVAFVRTEGFGPLARLWLGRRLLASLDAGRDHLSAGGCLVVFPEMALTRTGALRPFDVKFAAFLAALPAEAIVMVAYIDNAWGAWGSYSGGRLWAKRPESGWLTARRVAVAFGTPGGVAPAPQLRVSLVELSADCATLESRKLLIVPRLFVRQAASTRQLFRRAAVDRSTGQERILNWARLLVGVWALKDYLKSRVGPEPAVAIWHPTALSTALVNLALSFLGRTTVNLNYTAGPEAIASALRQAGVRTVITSRKFRSRVPLTVPDGIALIELEDAMAAMVPWRNLVRLVAVVLLPGWLLDRVLFRLHRIDPESPGTILFSSGSTGEPKGVVLSHRNITANVDGFRRGVQFTQADRMLVTLPIFHSFGYTVSFNATMAVGMEAVFHTDPRQAQEIGELCATHRCTILLGTATFLRLYLRRTAPESLRSLRLLVCGAEKLPVSLQDEFEAHFGVRPMEGYGCTELSPVVSTNLPDVTVAGLTQVANRPGTVGQPIPTVAARAFDCDTHLPLPPGEVGNLGVRGPNVMAGYLGRDDLTQAVVRDGWYLTGDVGRVDDDGFIQITGRLSRFAKIAGEMVPLERLDEELHELLGAPAERMLAVSAVPCARRGERVVVLYLDAHPWDWPGLFQGLRSRGLPNLWVPDARDCYPVAALPTLGTGKLDLRSLGELARRVAT